MDGVTYSWDNNGNLTSDGVFTYGYDGANRLVSMTDGVDTYTYAYNGLGDRVQQTVNGITTTYVLDLNTRYTQVLSDGTNTYLYGVGRFGEEGTAWSYHLGDALGSVRQLTDSAGTVSNARIYQPFGEIANAYGSGSSSYGFTGEMTDPSGMVYLRARYYAPGTGRFISRDVWEGDPMQPMGYNLWLYAYSNPVMFTDPSGEFGLLAAAALTLIGGTAGGAVVGAAVSYGKQVYQNIKNDGFSGESFTNVDAQKIKQGAITGAVGGFVSAAGTLAFGSGLAPVIGIGAISSVAAGQTQIVLDNASSNQKLTSGLFNPKDVLIDATIGAASGALGYGINNVIKNALSYKFKGGAYGKLGTSTPSGTPLQKHELIPDSARKIYSSQLWSRNKNPAIEMLLPDHYKTGTFGGRGKTGQPLRVALEDLVANGEIMEALELAAFDVQTACGNKYNSAIEEALQYGVNILNN